MATFTLSANWGTYPLTVTVVDTTSGATNTSWDFGDGTDRVGGSTQTHTYVEAGEFTVTLQNSTGEATDTVTVVAPYEITYGPSTNFFPLSLVNDEQYANIVLRGMSNQWPTVLYDDGNFPLRQLSVWPVPQQVNAVELWLWEPLLRYEDLDQELNLPPGYERYLRFKLAVELAAEFGKEVPQAVLSSLIEAEKLIKKLNQKIPVQNLSPGARALTKNARNWTIIDTYSGGDVLPNRVW